MSTIYGSPLLLGGKKPTPLRVSTNGTWSKAGGYSPVTVNIPAYEVTSGTKVITAEGSYDVTEFKKVRVIIGTYVSITPVEGLSYVDGLPNDWNRIKEIAKIISEASDSINANTTGSVYVNNGNTWAYKITPGNTISVTSTAGTYTYAVMGFNNFALTNQNHYGGNHTTAGLTFGAVDSVGKYRMNSSNTNSGGWKNCLMRTSTMPTLQNGMPATLAQVKVPYVNYNQSTILYSDDYLFLPAEKEVFGTRTESIAVEADALTQFAYYKNGGSKIKKVSGNAWWWWLRSAKHDRDDSFCAVWQQGGAAYNDPPNSLGASPCFCV